MKRSWPAMDRTVLDIVELISILTRAGFKMNSAIFSRKTISEKE